VGRAPYRCTPYLTKETRLDLVRRQLQPGQVLYLYGEFTHPHKDQFLVVAYAAPILGLLVINSEIPEYIQKRVVMQSG